MIINNFGLAANDYPGDAGDAAGFTIASNFMNVFGVAEQVTCWAGMWVPCPRTQGRTSLPGPIANSHYVLGQITVGSVGWLVQGYTYSDEVLDPQMGSWLIRESGWAAASPEPGSIGLILAGSASLILLRRRRADRTVPAITAE